MTIILINTSAHGHPLDEWTHSAQVSCPDSTARIRMVLNRLAPEAPSVSNAAGDNPLPSRDPLSAVGDAFHLVAEAAGEEKSSVARAAAIMCDHYRDLARAHANFESAMHDKAHNAIRAYERSLLPRLRAQLDSASANSAPAAAASMSSSTLVPNTAMAAYDARLAARTADAALEDFDNQWFLVCEHVLQAQLAHSLRIAELSRRAAQELRAVRLIGKCHPVADPQSERAWQPTFTVTHAAAEGGSLSQGVSPGDVVCMREEDAMLWQSDHSLESPLQKLLVQGRFASVMPHHLEPYEPFSLMLNGLAAWSRRVQGDVGVASGAVSTFAPGLTSDMRPAEKPPTYAQIAPVAQDTQTVAAAPPAYAVLSHASSSSISIASAASAASSRTSSISAGASSPGAELAWVMEQVMNMQMENIRRLDLWQEQAVRNSCSEDTRTQLPHFIEVLSSGMHRVATLTADMEKRSVNGQDGTDRVGSCKVDLQTIGEVCRNLQDAALGCVIRCTNMTNAATLVSMVRMFFSLVRDLASRIGCWTLLAAGYPASDFPNATVEVLRSETTLKRKELTRVVMNCFGELEEIKKAHNTRQAPRPPPPSGGGNRGGGGGGGGGGFAQQSSSSAEEQLRRLPSPGTDLPDVALLASLPIPPQGGVTGNVRTQPSQVSGGAGSAMLVRQNTRALPNAVCQTIAAVWSTD
jgi:hypothetical protein